MTELEKASEFMDTHARLLDRRRFELLFGDGHPEGVVAALAGYANADGGFGWALHPDLPRASSQPVGALHAFEVLEEVAASTSPLAARLCDWLDGVSLADGGLPFALPGADGAGSAPPWTGVDHSRSSLHITSAVCGVAHRVAEHDPAVAGHRWLARATDFCQNAIANRDGPIPAYELSYVLQFLDALHGKSADAAAQLERLGAFMPASGTMPVKGGAEDEKMRPLDFSPEPDRPLRALLSAEVVADDLRRLAADQREDGGWDVDFKVFSPAAALEWRGDATVRALKILKANGRLEAGEGGYGRQSRSS
jgi:hypothetical protein